jgi:thioredoxin-related protein
MAKKNSFFRVTVILVLFCFFGIKSFAQGEKPAEALEWHTDLMEAHDLSEKTKKPIFAFFTGSDWCGWCIKLQKDVFAKEEFIKWAKENVILLELDFPRNKQLPPALVQQNASLQQAFGITGYPTVWLFKTVKNNKEKKFTMDTYGSVGYPAGAEPGKEQVKFLEDINKIINDKKAKKS